MSHPSFSRWAPWVALPLVAAAAFFVGGALLGGGGGQGDADPAGHPAGHEEATIWTCSMHPQIRQPEPGQCPICGMDLIPVGGGEAGSDDPREVQLSERAKVLARIRTEEVRRRASPAMELRLLGRVDYDETRRREVTAWIGGRIDRLHVRATGQHIGRGQVIATLYSPEIYAAHQDLLTAARQERRLAQGSEIARSAAGAALEASRQRLRLLGVPEGEITSMEAATAPRRQVSIRSPFAGTVIERVASEGAYVQTGSPLYRLADLSRVWVQLEAYESDQGRLERGQHVELSVEALPGERFDGTVSFIDPTVDPRRRVTRVRVEVDNIRGRLRPGMFAEAIVQGSQVGGGQVEGGQVEGGAERQEPLMVPASAPLFTGRRSLVYVERPEADRPTYEARVVRLGPRIGDHYPVVAGLREGERVVIHGAYVLDADLQIRGGSSMMSQPDDSEPGAFDEAVAAPPALRASLAGLLRPYLDLQARLAEDQLGSSQEAARALLAAIEALEVEEPREAAEAYAPIRHHLRMHARQAAEAEAIEGVRAAFEPLSEQIAALLRRFGNPLEEPLRVAFCPMAFGNRGAEWIQRGERVDNAYFGSAMRSCGEIRSTVGPGDYLVAPPTGARRGAASPSSAAGGHAH